MAPMSPPTTISREQHALASQRVAEAGLQDRVTLLLQDYRDLQGQYDKLVSIEMIEATGAQYLDTFFGKLGSLLRPGGQALLQAITIEDHRYVQARDSVDYIKRFVFPGSFIPSINAILTRPQPRADNRPMQRAQPMQQAMQRPQAARPAIQERPMPARQASQSRQPRGVQTQEP